MQRGVSPPVFLQKAYCVIWWDNAYLLLKFSYPGVLQIHFRIYRLLFFVFFLYVSLTYFGSWGWYPPQDQPSQKAFLRKGREKLGTQKHLVVFGCFLFPVTRKKKEGEWITLHSHVICVHACFFKICLIIIQGSHITRWPILKNPMFTSMHFWQTSEWAQEDAVNLILWTHFIKSDSRRPTPLL